MIDRLTLHRWLYTALLLALCAFMVFVRLLPLNPGPDRLPGPDLILALCMAWAIRRPDYVPVLLVAGVFLLTDMLFQRPPGLHTVLVILALEFLRRREPASHERPFAVEWAMVSAILALILLAERSVLTVLFVDQVSFGRSVLCLLMTMAAYPLVVLVSAQVLGVRRITAAEADLLRRRANA